MFRKLALALAAGCVITVAWISVSANAHSREPEARASAACRPVVPPRFQALAQGWNEQQQQQFWFTSQGSEMLPRDWFLALEQPQGEGLFRESAHLRGFGFIPAPVSACNPDGLPIGFALDRDSGALGLTCAACHTRRLDVGGRELLVNGAPADIDFGGFVGALAASLERLLADPAALSRFERRLAAAGGRTDALADRLALKLVEMRRFQHFISAHAGDEGLFAGSGRVDAFGAIFNKITVDELHIEDNYAAADAPVSYPFIWGAARGTVTQWNGSAPNGVPFGPLARNLGVGLGLFGRMQFDQADGRFRSSAKIDNLQQLESLSESLRAPRWPAQLLPAIDRRQAALGERVYQQQCQGCHARPHDESEDYEPRLVPVAELGTDALAANNYFERNARTGALEGRRKSLLSSQRFGASAPSREIVVAAIVDVIAEQGIASVEASDLGALLRPRPVLPGPAYKARPLTGIWATAPYLHNGSVPTLADLLQAPSRRPARFALRPHSFDAARVGLDTRQPAPGTPVFDTAARGNANAGHAYGTDLPEADKAALVEFLKTL
jgi:mono/diheme cytochrome c family protein